MQNLRWSIEGAQDCIGRFVCKLKVIIEWLEAISQGCGTLCSFFYSFMVNHVLQEVGVTIEFMVFIILCFGLLALCLN